MSGTQGILEEVRYQCLRPAQIVARRKKLPLAWLPLGILEWHGVQNPTGLDALKAEGLCCYAARGLGGLVMPTLFWGDHRRGIAEIAFDPALSPWYPQDKPDQTRATCREMDLPREALIREAERLERGGDPWRVWRELMVNMLFEIESLGFACIAAYAGHAPLRRPLEEAVAAHRAQGGSAETVLLGIPGGEDHAARRETSMMLALCPGMADLGELAPDGSRTIGTLGEDPLKASEEFGWELVRKFEAQARLQLAKWIEAG
jgi:creatinine amidohydrolase